MTDPTQLTPGQQLVDVLDEAVFGKHDMVRMVVASFLAGGHVLLEGLPGLGKTVLARTMAVATGLDHKRIQFTPDLMPADITGTHLLHEADGARQFRFVPGPVFTNFLLADEINRASPKTQAALLEAMSEGSVTHAGETRPIPSPFFLLATQNPIEMEGTNPLPEAQLDRFAVKIDVPPTGEETLLRIIDARTDGNPPPPAAIVDKAGVVAHRRAIDRVFVPRPVKLAIARVVARTAPVVDGQDEGLRGCIRFGASPRAAIWLARIARALAYIDGRQGVGFEDVEEAVPHVLSHRLILTYAARLDGVQTSDIARHLYRETEREVLGIAQELAPRRSVV